MRELSKVEMKEVSGAGFLGDLFGDITKSADVALNSIGNAFVETGKVFTDFVFNTVKGFWEGRYTK
ncbi:hypothetical protein FHU10_2563 [Serratia fonticola]|jgi:hypothetical protein|uniref:Bacteriocin n=1 Tax=Serratia fonticola TaxID=47917 RepID=A0A542CXK4_SERFO|nr:hypothetical protein [Serratia fonticola]TQI82459.1 hypothetical protein FHU09_5146 [Serratia fonticola]TQI95522.1 hypothetical protein FHU11_0904 [Serratia fonticola]TVZ70017.1 hypothetical protein FHU10_2563 [Serratia fonticola]